MHGSSRRGSKVYSAFTIKRRPSSLVFWFSSGFTSRWCSALGFLFQNILWRLCMNNERVVCNHFILWMEWFLFSKRKTLLHFTLSKVGKAGYLQALFPFHFSFLWSSPRDLFWSSPWGLFEEKLIKFLSNAVSPSPALLGLGERQLKHVILRHTIPFSWLLAIRYKNYKLIFSLAWL